MFPVLQDSAETLSVKVGNYTFSCLLSEKSYTVKQPCQIRLNINNFWSRELGVIGYQKNFICIGHA